MVTSYDQGMDVYVVSNCWYREGGSVIGAGATEDAAREVADRADHLDGQSPGTR